tara:strand:+ start:2195 stop:3082 length:888 start_codon:yes stop_codon:yes gene_type:complete
MKNKQPKDRYQILTNQVIELMQEHGTNWIKPWQSSAISGHKNKFSNKLYQGTNIFCTAISAYAKGFSSNEWGTYKQWKEAGYQVKKGSKGTDIVYFDKLKIEDKDTNKDKFIPMIKGFSIFNAEQIDGYISADKYIEPAPFNHIKAETLVNNSQAVIKHGGSKAFYSPKFDFIQMPDKQDFKGTDTTSAEESYYSTLLHELSHWSGHEKRLDRKLVNRFGSKAYAFEELVAETSASFLSAILKVNNQPSIDNAKYLNSWLEILQTDKKAMMKAFSLAQKSADYLLYYSNQMQEVA